MAQLAAAGAYFYQAALALGLVVAISRLLPAADYTVYSFFIAISQFGAILAFEWIRFACSRFYPGPSVASETAERHAMRFGCLVSAIASVAIGLVAWRLGLPGDMALMGTCVAIFQGSSDLHLSMLRFRIAFRAFSWLQSARATILTAATLAGAVLGQTVFWAMAGLLAGYCLYGVVLIGFTRGIGGRLVAPDLALVRKHLVYGSVSAGASVASLLAPIGLKAILTAVLGAQAAAGALLAIDLLQRPFIMMVQAVQGTCYPHIVALYDRVPRGDDFDRSLGQYYGLLTGLTLMTAAGLLAVLGPAVPFLIAGDLQAGFLQAAPFVIAIAAMRALIQTMLPTPAHLTRRLPVILLLAVADCVLLNIAALLAMSGFGFTGIILLAGATVGAALAMLPGLVLLRTLPFRLPWLPLALAATALAVAIRQLDGTGALSVSALAGLAVIGLLCLAALWLLFRGMRSAQLQPAAPTAARVETRSMLAGRDPVVE
ncbi:hypothetical protein [Bosea sp. AAP35]|uniref:hypothetical protein n=1 Tax=Bosea sp. AAP35 TaxID=1523417 RepID=UPI000ACADD70|nr:hypothetical protein [Bosea sp. AAP35]